MSNAMNVKHLEVPTEAAENADWTLLVPFSFGEPHDNRANGCRSTGYARPICTISLSKSDVINVNSLCVVLRVREV